MSGIAPGETNERVAVAASHQPDKALVSLNGPTIGNAKGLARQPAMRTISQLANRASARDDRVFDVWMETEKWHWRVVKRNTRRSREDIAAVLLVHLIGPLWRDQSTRHHEGFAAVVPLEA
jgi:hypothetical protein